MAKPGQVRQKEILDMLKDQQHCTIGQLCKHFGISIPTVHRDIDELAASGLVRKIHGGVEYVTPPIDQQALNQSFQERILREQRAKQQIAHTAMSLLEEDDIVFMDSSTTVLHLARELAASNMGRITVVTNSCSIACEYYRFPKQMTLVNVGGIYNPQLNAFLGRIAHDTVAGLKINKVFLSAVGISGSGIYTYHEEHASFLNQLIHRSSENILLADHTKFNREALFRICELDMLQTIICDRKVPDDIAKPIRKAKCSLL